ncbi:MAG: hypothetical protein DRP70_00115 [Spirochaetes bacterium]|nr:MAG: hypothetical protein DRP70_00115 [Spirochaetota bacterium]RKX98638.1 MAG: hypothetical protein DRZ90_02190 [Spirochaetota bacterium]
MKHLATAGRRRGAAIRSLPAFFSVIMTLAAFAMSVNSIPPLVTTVIGDFSITLESFGYLFSVQFFVFMLASFAGGAFLERTDLKPGLLVAIGLAGLSASFFIIPHLSTFMELLVWIIFLGFSGGLVETFASVLVSGYDSRGSSRLLNLSQVFYCVGAIAAPQIVAFLLNRQVQWGRIFVFFGFLELLITILFIVFSYDDILGRSNAVETKHREKILFKDAAFFLLGLSIFFYVLSESFLVFWLPAYQESYYLFSPAEAARGVSLYWIGLIFGRLLIVFISENNSLWKILLISTAGMFISAVMLSFHWQPLILKILIIVIGLFSGPIWATIISAGKSAGGNPRFLAGVIGAGSLGASLGPLVSSRLIRYGGFGLFFPGLSTGIAILFGLLFFSKINIKHKELSSQ